MSEFEHGQQSPWGYIIDAETIPGFITDAEFDAFTANKYHGDVRIAKNIPSASQTIRNYCGWHISPSLECGMLYRIQDIRDAFIGPDVLIQLPATYVSAVSKIVLDAKWNADEDDWDGEIITDPDRFDFGTANGLLRVFDVGPRDRRSKIFIRYTAGLPDGAIPSIKELTANLITHAIASPYGVSSEAAGGVSISYSSTWAGRAGSTALTNDTREVLDAYKVKGVY